MKDHHHAGRRVKSASELAAGSYCLTLLLACALAATTARADLGRQGPEPKRGLIVQSFGGGTPPFTVHSRAFETELVEKLGQPVDLDEVSLDMARFAEPAMQ